jgi:hypothetical protein
VYTYEYVRTEYDWVFVFDKIIMNPIKYNVNKDLSNSIQYKHRC